MEEFGHMESLRDLADRAQFAASPPPPSLLGGVRKAFAKWLVPEAFKEHAPLSRVAGPLPRRDGTQIAIFSKGTFVPGTAFREGLFRASVSKDKVEDEITAETASELGNLLKERFKAGWKLISVEQEESPSLPTISGSTRLFQSLRPERMIAYQTVYAIYGGNGVPDRKLAFSVPRSEDLVLIQAYSGAMNCFPNAPCQDTGIPGIAFAYDSANAKIEWPTINTGVDMTLSWAIESSVLYHAPVLPDGYDPVPKIVTVKVRAALFGPVLR